jgi:hypothetical protein
MEISLDMIHKRLATTAVVSCRARKALRKLTFTVDDCQSSIRQLKSKCRSADMV